jgi:hypothetical protein
VGKVTLKNNNVKRLTLRKNRSDEAMKRLTLLKN